MTIKTLKKYIEDMPNEAVILIPGFDHSYRAASLTKTTALYDEDGCIWSEDYGEDSTPEKEYGKRIPVLVVK